MLDQHLLMLVHVEDMGHVYKALVELQRCIVCGGGLTYAEAKASCVVPYFQVHVFKCLHNYMIVACAELKRAENSLAQQNPQMVIYNLRFVYTIFEFAAQTKDLKFVQ